MIIMPSWSNHLLKVLPMSIFKYPNINNSTWLPSCTPQEGSMKCLASSSQMLRSLTDLRLSCSSSKMVSNRIWAPGSTVVLGFYFVLETGFCYVTQASLKLVVILLHKPPQCWDYRHVLPHLVTTVIFCPTNLGKTLLGKDSVFPD